MGVRLIADGPLGYAYAADPSDDEVRGACVQARENAALSLEDRRFNGLPDPGAAEPLAGLFRDVAGRDHRPTRRSELALELERGRPRTDPRVTKIEAATFGDAVGRVAIASTTGVRAE